MSIIHEGLENRKILGIDIKVDPLSASGWSSVPGLTQRRQMVLQDSFASGKYSHVLLQSFISALLGWQHADLGIFGDIEAYHFNGEEQGRGSIHWHGLVWLKYKPSPSEFKHKLTDPTFSKRVLRFLDGLIKQSDPEFLQLNIKVQLHASVGSTCTESEVPPPPVASSFMSETGTDATRPEESKSRFTIGCQIPERQRIPVWGKCTVCKKAHHFIQKSAKMEGAAQALRDDCPPAICRVNFERSVFKKQLFEQCCKLVDLQTHRHSDGCYKGIQQTRAYQSRYCRYGYPRAIETHSCDGTDCKDHERTGFYVAAFGALCQQLEPIDVGLSSGEPRYSNQTTTPERNNTLQQLLQHKMQNYS